ncbi:acyl-activating enzyme [Salix suchowensis]|nr:acyl-activating enzyme [Salix suchowensis]
MEGIYHCPANYVPLSPISFLERAAAVYGDKLSIVYGRSVRFSWKDTLGRCVKVASALVQLKICPGDIVVALAPNVPALYELHFGVPMAGAVLSALNTRLDAPTLALILEQLEAKLIFVDYQYTDVALKALELLSCKNVSPPHVVVIPECDKSASSMDHKHIASDLDYNCLLEMGRDDFRIIRPSNECDPISVSYTSGSTGNPKGVVYSHRAAYLNSMAEIFRFEMRQMPVFLWTVDMFRCNGWCLAWAMAAIGGTNICLRNVSAEIIFDAISLHKVTHFCATTSSRSPLSRSVNVVVAGSLPNPEILAKVEGLGFNVYHGYGMTEALGPATVRPWKPELDSPLEIEQEIIRRREGLHNLLIEGVDVKDPKTMKSVPNDGKTIGEVMFRGNILMSGYLKSTETTRETMKGGWFHTGDLGVRHPSGFVQMKDRAKDIIISGGEAVSTLEVEAVLLSHPEVLEAAVVGQPDALLNEVPCAFVRLKEGFSSSAEDIIEFCGDQLPDHMIPKSIVFGELPVNFSGKVQKFSMRETVNGSTSLAN